MESSMMPNNYTNNNDVLYGAHYATLVSTSVTYENPIGKFILSYVTPNMDDSSIYERTLPKNSTSNVINKDNLGTTKITTSNYINIEVPRYMFYIENIEIISNTQYSGCVHCGFSAMNSCNPQTKITRKSYKKGQKFAIINIGGDIDTPYIIGVM